MNKPFRRLILAVALLVAITLTYITVTHVRTPTDNAIESQLSPKKTYTGPSRQYWQSSNSPNVPLVNAITDSKWGHLKNFLYIRKKNEDKQTPWMHNITLEVGSEYEVLGIIHHSGGEDSPPLGDVKARIISQGRMQNPSVHDISLELHTAGTLPSKVFDSVQIGTNFDSALRKKDSVRITASDSTTSREVSDTIFEEPTRIDCNAHGPMKPGDYCYLRYSFVSDVPGFDLHGQAKSDESEDWMVQDLYIHPGKTAHIRAVYQNTGTVQQNNVYLIGELSDSLSYVDKSTHVATSVTKGQWARINESPIGRGISIGSYSPQATSYTKFQVSLSPWKFDCSPESVNLIISTDNGTRNSTINIFPARCKNVK